MALSLGAEGARAEEKLPRFAPGALEAVAAVQTVQGAPGKGVQSDAGESTAAPRTSATASADPQASTPSDPEPQTWALMGAGLFAAAMIRRRMERR